MGTLFRRVTTLMEKKKAGMDKKKRYLSIIMVE